MQVEINKIQYAREYPKRGDAVSFSDGWENTVCLVIHIPPYGQYILVDLSDGEQIWSARKTIKELMDQVGNDWTIHDKAKVVV